jgi:hypothetical protein
MDEFKENVQPEDDQELDTKPTGEQAESERVKAAQKAYEPEYDRPAARRSSDNRPNAFNTLAWLVEGATGMVEELRHSDLGLSEEFWVHLYAMRREGLLAARAGIDSLLARAEEESRKAKDQIERKARRGDIAVD